MDLHSSYNSSGESVHDLFDSREEGFFVPVYQREYTWEEENINRLFEDLVLGIRELTNDDGEYTTTFLGTTILTNLQDKGNTVNQGDVRAQDIGYPITTKELGTHGRWDFKAATPE